jgi:hypothetical protein
MANTAPTNPPGGGPTTSTVDPADIGRIEREALGWKNILRLKLQINEASKEQNTFQKEINKLQGQQAKDAAAYKKSVTNLANLEKNLAQYQAIGNRRRIQQTQQWIAAEKKAQVDLAKTTGGALRMQEAAAAKQAARLKAEKQLISDINKERGLGGKLADLFRTKEQRQKQIDLARAKAGGGANVGTAGSSGATAGGAAGGGGDGVTAALAAAGPWGALAAVAIKAVNKIKASFKALGSELKNGMVASLQSAAALIGGDAVGMGGGAVSGVGATSMLDGLGKVASALPFVGGLLGGLVGGFKTILDAALGVQQANFKVARSMNISAGAAEQLRDNFDKVAAGSNNLVVNSTRMLQSYIEIGNQLGINAKLSDEIYATDVKLRDILGLEVQSRKEITDQAIVTGRSAENLTKSAIGTVASFNKLVGTSFKWSSILSEASKLGGVLGLTLTKYPEKIYNAVAATKALGMDLKSLDSTASSFLDFESSISKEFEAQVLTGREINLTAARNAALNNDYATLSAEITKNVGSAADYLKLTRIEQEGVAAAVGMTRDGLGDVLKKQEIYSKAGVTDQKGLVAKLEMLEKQKKTQQEISTILGKDGYEIATQVSTAENLTEVMNNLQRIFVKFVKDSGLFEFLTNPARMADFVKGVTDAVSGAVSFIGDLIADLLEAVGSVADFFGGDKYKWLNRADTVRSKSGNFAGSIKSVGSRLAGSVAGSIGETVQQGTQVQSAAGATTAPAAAQPAPVFKFKVDTYVGTQKWSEQTRTSVQQDSGMTIS